MKITKSQMMPLLLEACPSFNSQWRAFTEEWQSKIDPPLYLVFGDLVRHLSTSLRDGQMSEFPAVFQTVERLITEGDEYVSEGAVIGILEDLQNPALHEGTRPEQFVPYLGGESKLYWSKLQHFWNGSTRTI